MNREELRWFLPPAVIAVLVFLGVMTSFIAGGVRRTQTDLGVATEVSHNRANAVFTLTDETGEAELICIVSANPRNGALTVVAVPPEIPVDIAGSRQTLGASMAIGGTDMLMEKLAQVVPLPLHHYMTLDRTVLEHTLSALGVDGSAFFTANSPKSKPPMTEKEPDSVLGVFIEAIFSPSMANSMMRNWRNRGTAKSPSVRIKRKASGMRACSRTARSQSGIKKTEAAKTRRRTRRR